MTFLSFVVSLLLIPSANAVGTGAPSCGSFLANYVLHLETAFLILPLENGDAEISRKLKLKTAAEARHYLELNPDDPWRAELENLPSGYFRDHVILRTEVGPTGWNTAELESYLELVRSRVAANVKLARPTLLNIANGDMVPHFTLQAQSALAGRTLELRDDRGTLWLARAMVREGLIRHKLAMVHGQLKPLDQVLKDEEIFFFAAFPELVAFWPWRHEWHLQLPDPLLRTPGAIALPGVDAGGLGTCDLEISREAWRGTDENLDVQLRLTPRCQADGPRLRKWFRAQWEHYLDLLNERTRGEMPYMSDDNAFAVDFDSRSAPRGIGFYVFLNERLTRP